MNKYEMISIIKCQLKQLDTKINNKQKGQRSQKSHKSYKQICMKINRALAYAKFYKNQLGNEIEIILAQFKSKIKFIIQMLLQEDNGTEISSLKKILQKIKQVGVKKQIFENQKTSNLIINPVVSVHSKNIKLGSVYPQDFTSLTYPDLQNTIKSISFNQVVLSNNECLCCSKIYVQNQIVSSQSFKIVQIKSKIQINKQIIQKYVCSLANEGGGLLIIGAEKHQHGTKIKGFSFQSRQELSQKQEQIKQAMQKLIPLCSYKIDKVIVRSQISNKQQNNLVCFRVTLRMLQPKKLAFLFPTGQSIIQNASYQSFVFDQLMKINKLPFQIIDGKEQNIYNMMHKKFKKNNNNNNIVFHKQIQCSTPIPLDNNFIFENKALQQQQFYVENKFNESQPKFKYKNTSLLIVKSKTHDRHIIDLKKTLQSEKIVFQCEKPFPSTFKPQSNVRSVWMLSHQCSFIQMKNHINDLQKSNIIQPKFITLLPVYNTIQLQMERFQSVEKDFKNKFSLKYQPNFAKQTAKLNFKTVVNLTFDSLKESIYAYLILQYMGIWPYFIKEGTVYKKKKSTSDTTSYKHSSKH